MKKLLLLISLIVGCAQHSRQLVETKKHVAWIEKSDRLAEQFTKSLAVAHPEVGSELGYKEFDKHGLLHSEDIDERDRAFFAEWMTKLERETDTDTEFQTDIAVLKSWLQNQVRNFDVYRAAHEVEFQPAAKFVYQNLDVLLNAQSTPERKSAAVDRFHVYVKGDRTHKPLLEAMQDTFRTRLKRFKDKNPLLPYRNEVEEYLRNMDAFTAAIEDMLKGSGRSDWSDDLKTFKQQNEEYKRFATNEVLPNTRTDSRIPREIYAQILKRRGIDATPEELIKTATADYKKIYKAFENQARFVAKKNGFKKSHPAEVIHFLKTKAVTSAKEVEELYKTADQRLDKIMRDNALISVPVSPLRIRVAGEAESKAIPIPHLKPPPLVNGGGQRPEFVVPSSAEGLPFDDFSSPYAAVVLTAHEGRPGHDMQYSQMLDQGLSVIRSRYAVNNVNIEGWALYAEDLVYPYLTPEEQLFALQTRLWRVARMFLDPELQLGRIKDQRVLDVFTKELGVSQAMANLELRRYKYDDIGQAPSYYYGYLLVKRMRDETQSRLGEKFDVKCFNDRLLSFGLLPLTISAERMKNQPPCTKTTI